MESDRAVRALGAIAHASRLAVFRLLVSVGPEGLAAGTIAGMLDIAPSALSFHLKDLTQAGLLTQRPEGRRVVYAADFSAMSDLLAYLTENCCGGESCAALWAAPVQAAACCC